MLREFHESMPVQQAFGFSLAIIPACAWCAPILLGAPALISVSVELNHCKTAAEAFSPSPRQEIMACCIDTSKGGLMLELISTGQLARLIGVPLYKIAYAHLNQNLAEPACRILGKRMYTVEDVRRVAEHFAVETKSLDFANVAAEEDQ